jgi:transcriptional antiterminator RfaH
MWHAIYTKTKKEDSVAFRLQNIGVEVLNPRLKSRKFKNNRRIEVTEPLFPCYFFARFDTDKYSHLIKYTRGVRYVVGRNNPLSVPADVIQAIKENMDENNIVIVKPWRLSRGDKVLIRDGPFRDFHGIFEKEIKGPERVTILLEAMNCRLVLDSCCLAVA